MSLYDAHVIADQVEMMVKKAYPGESFDFGPGYIIPKPFDARVLIWEAAAVADAAIRTGAARIKIDIEEYKETLEKKLGKSREITRIIINKAKGQRKRVVFPEGAHEKILLASQILIEDDIATPILVGNEDVIRDTAKSLDIDLSGVELVHPYTSPKFEEYILELYNLRNRKGVTLLGAREQMKNRTTFGCMMVHKGDADAIIAGMTQNYPDTIRPALQIIGTREDATVVSGLYIIACKDKAYFFADTTVNIEPDEYQLSEIALQAAEMASRFGVEPRVAMLSFSNFGSARHPLSERVRKATELIKQKAPTLIVDGEMQADTAVMPELIERIFPFSTLKNGANVLIFPDLHSGNIAYKLVQRLGKHETIGPILMGMKKPVHVLQRSCEVKDIINMAALAVVEAQGIGSENIAKTLVSSSKRKGRKRVATR